MKSKWLLASLSASGALCLLAFVILGKPKPDPRRDGQRASPPPPPPVAADDPYAQLRDLLKSTGWRDSVAQKVANLHADWFVALSNENPGQAQLQLTLLKGLGQYPEVMDLMQKHPEVAGLLAAADDPKRVCRTLTSAGTDYDLVAGLYVQHAAPEDAALLAEALEKNRSLICRLIRRGMLGAELPFLFRRTDDAAAEYGRWLAEELQAQVQASDEERTAFQMFLLDQGPQLRERLRADTRFRNTFRTELWPKLSQVVGQTGDWALYTGEPHLWELLALSEGERLLKQHGGRLPILLLFEEGAYPTALHGLIVRALLDDDQQFLQALAKFRGEPLFVKLLQRDLPRLSLERALRRLLGDGPNFSADLALFNRLGDGALIEELQPPPEGLKTWVPLYDTYYLGKKLLQGRDPSTLEWMLAVADPASFLLPELKLGGKGLKKGGEEAFKLTLKQAGKDYAQKLFARQAARTGARITADQAADLAARLLGKGLEREVTHYGITSLLTRLQAPLRQALLRATTVEVTKPVQVLFAYSGLSRATFKRLMGLEARLFMRGDAKVYVRLGNTVAGPAVSRLINEVNDRVADQAIDAVENTEQLRSWRRNVSGWWLLNASGLGDAPRAVPGRN